MLESILMKYVRWMKENPFGKKIRDATGPCGEKAKGKSGYSGGLLKDRTSHTRAYSSQELLKVIKRRHTPAIVFKLEFGGGGGGREGGTNFTQLKEFGIMNGQGGKKDDKKRRGIPRKRANARGAQNTSQGNYQ